MADFFVLPVTDSLWLNANPLQRAALASKRTREGRDVLSGLPLRLDYSPGAPERQKEQRASDCDIFLPQTKIEVMPNGDVVYTRSSALAFPNGHALETHSVSVHSRAFPVQRRGDM